MSHWIEHLARSRKPRPIRNPCRARLAIEALEDRAVPATLAVNSALDNTASDTVLTLREAVALVNNAGDANAALGRALSASEQARITGTFGTNDTITLPTHASFTLTLGDFTLSTSVVIDGNGATLNAASGDRHFTINGAATVGLQEMTLRLGDAGAVGGSIYNGGTLTLTTCTLIDNTAGSGGAIYNEGMLDIITSSIVANDADADGGGIYNDISGTLEVTRSTIGSNTAGGTGGGIVNHGTATFESSTIADNESGGDGGGIAQVAGTVTLRNTLVAENRKTAVGPFDISGSVSDAGFNLVEDAAHAGGIDPSENNSLVGLPALLSDLGFWGGPTPTYTLLPGSAAIDAGGPAGTDSADQRGSTVPINIPGVTNRTDGRDIGAVEVRPMTVVVGDTLDNNTRNDELSLREAVALVNGTLTVAELTANERMSVTGDAGFGSTIQMGLTLTEPIVLTSGQLTLTQNVLINNVNSIPITVDANGQSRHFQVDAGVSATIQNIMLTGGSVGSGMTGGSILNFGTLTVSRIALFGNSAAGGGGAIQNAGGTLNVIASTLTDNSTAASGGAISGGGSLDVSSSTISGNTARFGGGIYLDEPASSKLTSSIVAGNTATDDGDDITGDDFTTDGGFNLIGDPASARGISAANSNLIGVDPLLAALGSYGGRVQTMALLPGSPAIDMGTGGSQDARGVSVQGGRRDIGAFESRGFNLSIVSGNNQSTPIDAPFPFPLTVMVTPNNASEPVIGGQVAISANFGGPQATFAPNPAVIGADRTASSMARANGLTGAYSHDVTATRSNTIQFSLTNLDTPPANLVVDILDDEFDGNFNVGDLSLREAIFLANANLDHNTITFAPALTAAGDATVGVMMFDTGLDDGEVGPTAFTIFTPVTISGPTGPNGIRIERTAIEAFRLFMITGMGGDLTLENLTLAGGVARGGDGGYGIGAGGAGGGAAGLGGAIFNFGTLTIRNSTLTDNIAWGGGGEAVGLSTGEGAGGGGGLGADGETATNDNGGAGGGPNGGTGGTTAGAFPTAGGFGGGGGGGSLGEAAAGAIGGFGGGGGGGSIANRGGGGGFGAGGGGGGGATGALGGTSAFGGGTGGTGGSGGGAGGGGGGGAGMGGAVFNRGGTVTIINSTLSSNTARGGDGEEGDSGGQGGAGGSAFGAGVFNSNGDLTITNSTFAGNTVIAGQGAGGAAAGQADGGAVFLHLFGFGTPSLELNNTILSGSTGAANELVNFNDDATTSGVGNLVRSHTGFTGEVVSTADPLLGPLQDNGGPTETHALGDGSPAANAGNNAAAAALAFDQRGPGFDRTRGGRVDLGAVESNILPPTPPATDTPKELVRVYQTITGRNLRANRRRGLLRDFGRAARRRIKLQLVRGPELGKLLLRKDGSFVYTPPPGFTGQVTFVVRRFDNSGLDEQVTVELNVTPRPRVFAVLPGQTLEVSAADGLLRDVRRFERGPVTVQLVDGPRRGRLELRNNGAFIFVAPANFRGRTTFRYQLVINGAPDGVGRVVLTTEPHPLAEQGGPPPA